MDISSGLIWSSKLPKIQLLPEVASGEDVKIKECGERLIPLSTEDLLILNNRRLLFDAMAAVGFTNYREEWWPYD